jgi:hypothetical protein
LIGADLRNPQLKRFTSHAKKGLSDFLASNEDEATLESFIETSTLNPNLDILPSGTIPPNPTFLLSSTNMEKIYRALKSKYKYIVFGTGDEGDAELADMLMMVQNEISEKLQVVSAEKAKTLIAFGEKVASPKINVKTEKWDGGHTYISISFYDYDTNQSIAVIKSSGIGWSISQDQKLAYKAIKKELDKVFPQTR